MTANIVAGSCQRRFLSAGGWIIVPLFIHVPVMTSISGRQGSSFTTDHREFAGWRLVGLTRVTHIRTDPGIKVIGSLAVQNNTVSHYVVHNAKRLLSSS
jgi:hypothetical protein